MISNLRKIVSGFGLVVLSFFYSPQNIHAQNSTENVVFAEADRLTAESGSFFREGDYASAVIFAKQSLNTLETELGPNHPFLATSLDNLAAIYLAQGELETALPLAQRSLVIREASLGPDHPSIGTSLETLSKIYRGLGLLETALPLAQRSLDIHEATLGPDHLYMATSLDTLAFIYVMQGEHTAALPLYQRSLGIREALLAPDHPDISISLENLVGRYKDQGAVEVALPLALRSVAIREVAFGLDHIITASSLDSLASLYLMGGNYNDAEPLYQRSLSIREAVFEPNHPSIASNLNNLALLYKSRGEYEEAKPLLRRAVAIYEVAFGPNDAATASGLNNLAGVYLAEGSYKRALPLYERALSIRKQKLGSKHPNTMASYKDLGKLYQKIGDFHQAHSKLKSAVDILGLRALSGSSLNSFAQKEAERELKINSEIFYDHAYASIRLAGDQPAQSSDLLAEGYSSSQYALRTSAGAALGQAASRFAAKDDALSDAVRQRQDLTREWSAVNESLISSIGSAYENRNRDAEQGYRERLTSIDDEIAEIDIGLEANFPEYFALTSSKPLGVGETQELLFENEALVMFLAGDEGTLVFAINKDKADWALVDMDASVLDDAIRVLRPSLENPQQAFPRGQAHGIFKKLMGGVEKLVSDKDHVFLVPSGALGSIPLGVLVTDKPKGDDRSPDALRATKWWGTQQALTTMPSISSLKALRLLAKDGHGKEPFAGFGNPVLTGPDGTDRSARIASRGAGAYFKGKYADVEAVRSLSPLPKTETELLSLASALRAKPKQSLWLGDRATETNLKMADLSEKRVLAFATHGLMSGEMSGLAEPALVLTPPDFATDEDDGLLTASEAALLNLNADWVILSACNTAAADQPGADGLSGLARSFFYAGARSMLVSHWPVRDDSAARLTTAAISMQDDNPDLGRAEALRRSMLVLMSDTSDPSLAHPSAWAPFVIVGEGGSKNSPSPNSFDVNTLAEKSQSSSSIFIAISAGSGMLLLLFGVMFLLRQNVQN